MIRLLIKFVVAFMLILNPMILEAKHYLLLIHGINDTTRSFKKMEKYFQQDYSVIKLEYPSLKFSIPELSEKYLKPEIEKIPLNDTLSIVTHSMGAIILRQYLKDYHPTNIDKIVMVSPPNHGSEVANFFHNFFLYKLIYKKAGSSLSYSGLKKLNLPANIGYNCGIIAGTGTQLPFFSIFIKGKDDGKISVNRTKLSDMKDFISLHYPHDTIIRKKKTIKTVACYLEYGFFKKRQSF